MSTKERTIFRYFCPLAGGIEIVWSTGEVERIAIPEHMTGFEFLQSLRRK